MAANEKITCCECGKTLAESKFFTSSSVFYSGIGKIPICKDCLCREYQKYKIHYRSGQKAMQRLCMILDLYWDSQAFNQLDNDDKTVVGKYISRMNMRQYQGKTFDNAMEEGFYFTGEKTQFDLAKRKQAELENEPIDPEMIAKWGEGFHKVDYEVAERHDELLKNANPNRDINQEIFIEDLCLIKMKQKKALRDDKIDDFNKLTDLYRKTFDQAGLKATKDSSAKEEFTIGVNAEMIEKYTPAEYYRNKELYKDYDKLGEYISRFVYRPLRNLMHGTDERDFEYYVKEEGDVDEFNND